MVILLLKNLSGCRCERQSSLYGLWRGLFNTALVLALISCLGFTPAAAEPVKILMLGDSLSAGYGLVKGQSVPAQLEKALRSDGLDVVIVNGGVSGDTSAGGLSRFDWAVAGDPEGLILELGANDGLRGLDPRQTFANLDAIITRARDREMAVLLTGMLAPPNLGSEYGAEFNRIYPDLADKHGVAIYPFFLEGVVGDPALNQDDGIHPNEQGVAIIVENLLAPVKNLISQITD